MIDISSDGGRDLFLFHKMDIEKVWPGNIVHALLAINSNPIKDMAIPLSCCSILMFMLEEEKISAMSPSIMIELRCESC